MDKRPKRRKLLKEGVKVLGFIIGLLSVLLSAYALCVFAIQRQRQMSIWKNILMMKIKIGNR